MDIFCRCCAKKSEYLQEIFKKDKSCVELVNVVNMLKIFKIEITSDDMLPKTICKDCLSDIEAAHKFYSKVAQSQIALINLLSQIQHKRSPIILPKVHNAPRRCTYCSKLFDKEENFKNHLREKHFKKKRNFNCYECSISFMSRKLLIEHDKSHAYLNKNICKFCNTFSADDNLFKNHVEECHSSLKYVCKKCSIEVYTRRNLLLHMNQKHKTCLFFCNSCQAYAEYKGRDELGIHIKIEHADFIKGNFADKQLQEEDDLVMDEEFLDEFFLNQDENFQLNEYWDDISLSFDDDFKEKMNRSSIDAPLEKIQTRYKCPKCRRGIGKQSELKKHLAHEHDLKTLVCNFCELSFNRLGDLKAHRSQHTQGEVIEADVYIDKLQTENRIRCSFCSQSFLQCNEMCAHQKSVHLNRVPQCTLCNKTFKTFPSLKYHLKVHSGCKDYHCHFCGKKFTAEINLDAHIRSVHSEVKPHVCNLCDRRFATTDHLRKHVTSVHQKERNYLCSICGKRFSQNSHLKQHLVVHAGLKSFQCNNCPKAFFRAIDLSRHILKSHREGYNIEKDHVPF